MSEEPPGPRAEFWVAVAGPAASLAIGLVSLATSMTLGAATLGVPAAAVVAYLGWINLVLVAFNLVPAFPLDGGRVLRAALWNVWDDLKRATKATASVGSIFGLALILLGGWSMVQGQTVAGIWWVMIGLFLRGAAITSYRQLKLRQSLEGAPVDRFVDRAPVTVPRALSVRQLYDDYLTQHEQSVFPVVEGDRLVGYVRRADVEAMDPEEWDRQSVGALVRRCDAESAIGADDDAMEALVAMCENHATRVLVVDRDHFVGMLVADDLFETSLQTGEHASPDENASGKAVASTLEAA